MYLARRNTRRSLAQYPRGHRRISRKSQSPWRPDPATNRRRSHRSCLLSNLPRVSGREVVKALARIGYQFDRQKGSHMILRHSAPPYRRVVVPDHAEVAKGTLRAILRQAGLTAERFAALL